MMTVTVVVLIVLVVSVFVVFVTSCNLDCVIVVMGVVMLFSVCTMLAMAINLYN